MHLFIHSASARGAYRLINLEKGLPISAVKGVSPRVRESPGLRDPPPPRCGYFFPKACSL